MLNRGVKRKAYGQTALTALCAAGLFSVIYLIRGFYPFGDGSIVLTDLYSQYVPLLYRFYDVVTGQKNLFLDFSVSGGANLYVDTINEVINPFNYVLLLFGRDRIYQAVNVVLLLYVTAAAASADFFLLKAFPKSRRWNVVLSLCYAFSGYMAYNYQIIKWMYFPVLFPLFCLALRRLLREKKGGLYAALLGYQLALSIQLGFMTLLFVLFSGGICFLVQKSGQTGKPAASAPGEGAGGCVKKEDRQACRLGLYTIVGLLLSGAVLLPNVRILLSSSRAGENLSYLGVMKRHGLDDLFERLFQIAQPVQLSLFAWAFAGWRRKVNAERREAGGREAERRKGGCGETGSREAKRTGRVRAALQRWKSDFACLPEEGRFLFWMNALLWLTVLLQPANLLWHMGSYMCFPVRYGYMVLLSGICLTKWLLTLQSGCPFTKSKSRTVRDFARIGLRSAVRPNGNHLTEREAAGTDDARQKGGRMISLCAAALCIAACLLTCRWEDRIVQAFSSLAISLMCPKETIVVCAVLLLFFAAGLCSLAGRGRLTAGVTVLCGLCLNLFIFLPPDYGVRLSNEAAYRKMTQQAAGVLAEADLSGADMARAQGDTAVELQSAGNEILHRVKDDPELPLNAALVNGKNSLTGYFPTASQSFKNAMESLGYLVPWVATQSVGGTEISDDLLSMGLLLEKEASGLALQSGSVLGRQEELAEFVGGGGCLERIAGGSLKTADGGAALVTVEGEKTLYLDPAMTADGFRVFVNGEETEVPEEASAFSIHRIVEVGTFADETAELLVTDKSGAALPLADMEIGMLDRSGWRGTIEALRQESDAGIYAEAPQACARELTGEELEIDASHGRIRISLADAEAEQTVFLPIAALDGWYCVLNGENVDISPVFGGFLGIMTRKGKNEIVLRFAPPGLGAGLALTVLGAIGLLAGAFAVRRWEKQRGGQRGAEEELPAGGKRLTAAMSMLYRIIFAGGLLGIYVIPAAGLVCYMAAKALGIF